MAIVSTDIVFQLSQQRVSGSAGYTTASTPGESLGGYVSTTVWSAGTNTLFDDITATENAAYQADYRCVFVLNNHPTLTLKNAVVYIGAQVDGGADITIAVDDVIAQDKGIAAIQAAMIPDGLTAPTGVGVFSGPTSVAGGLALGDLPPGTVRAVWVRRAAVNSAALPADGFTLACAGDTDA